MLLPARLCLALARGRALTCTLSLLSVLAACGSDPGAEPTSDAATTPDAASQLDAEATPEAGPQRDAEAMPDTGTELDAEATPDAGPQLDAATDAGPQLDAAARDAGPQLELGSGEVAFEAVQQGDHLQLHAGSQGGYHVWLSIRARGFKSDKLRFVLDVVPSAPAPPAHTDTPIRFTPVGAADGGAPSPDAGGPLEFIGWPARVLAPECAVGKTLRLSVQLDDGLGQTAKGELEVVADPPAIAIQDPCTL